MSMDVYAKARDLEARLREFGSLIVAYSGGVDSAYLAWAAHEVLGSQMVALTADSPSLPRAELARAAGFAAEHGIPWRTIQSGEMGREEYARNGADRCFYCKDEMFRVMETELERSGFLVLAYGFNAGDREDRRPGHKAAALHRVAAPLADAGLNKQEIRGLAREAGLSVWDKPAAACLASRIEYGRRVTVEALGRVEAAEESLRRLGFRQFRVRDHGQIARIEISPEEMGDAIPAPRLKAMGAAVKAAGFLYVALDCEGYRSGSMNEAEPLARSG